MSPRVVIIQFPGVNCEYETARALESAGLRAAIVRWNAASHALREAAAIVIPGGFAYQDRIRAGVVAAKDRVVDGVWDAASQGVPVLGICNGAQILVEAGIVPGFAPGTIELAVAPNRMPDRHGYFCTWVHVKVGPARCLFTDFLTAAPDDSGTIPLPVAHAEGRFVTSNPQVAERLRAGDGVALEYGAPDGRRADGFPLNPNGAMFAIAGVTNAQGNVLALMPHPERANWFYQVPRRVGGWWGRRRAELDTRALDHPGPGRGLFVSLERALRQ